MLRGNKSDCTMLILGIRKKALVSKKLRVNPKRFEKLIISLRTAYARNLVLDKEHHHIQIY